MWHDDEVCMLYVQNGAAVTSPHATWASTPRNNTDSLHTFDFLNKLLVVVLQKTFAGANFFFATPTIIYKIDMRS